MSILYLLIGLALLLMGVAVVLFAWTVRNSQYEDLDGPAYRILMDDDDARIPGAQLGRPAETTESSPVSRSVGRGKSPTNAD